MIVIPRKQDQKAGCRYQYKGTEKSKTAGVGSMFLFRSAARTAKRCAPETNRRRRHRVWREGPYGPSSKRYENSSRSAELYFQRSIPE